MIRFLLFLIMAVSCQNHPEVHVVQKLGPTGTTDFSGEAMTMHYKIIVGAVLNQDEIHAIKDLIAATFNEVDQVYNKWNLNSEVSHLNRIKSGIKVQISPELQRLFNETQLIVELSEGRFDPTIEPLQRLWKINLQEGRTPSQEEIEAIAPVIGWDKIHVVEGVFSKDHDKTELDFGGIAKGLAIDLLVERFQQKGYRDLFVEWGGEIRAIGVHPEQRPWTVYISRFGDDDPEHAIDTLFLNNQAIATSGDYLQNWSISSSPEENRGKIITYFHIFDSETLHPLKISSTSIASVSVVAENCAFADGLATAVMLCPDHASAEAWVRGIIVLYPNVSFWIASRNQVINILNKQ